MVKLIDAIAGKGGNWFAVGDVITVPLRITEDLSVQGEIRKTEDGKYFCIQVSDGKETKDLHVASGALKAIAATMPQEGTWKDKYFVIDAVTGKGYGTKTHVSSYRPVVDPAAQQRVGDYAAPRSTGSPQGLPQDAKAYAVAEVLTAMRGFVAGVHESRLEDFVKDTLTAKGIIASVSETMTAMKYSGRIRNDAGVWKVV